MHPRVESPRVAPGHRFLSLCAAYDIPRPRPGVAVAGRDAGFVWPEAHLVARTGEPDRMSDAELALAGLRVVRFTDRQVARRPDTVAATVRALLGLSPARRAAARPPAGRRAS
jgi:hypothetical protein